MVLTVDSWFETNLDYIPQDSYDFTSLRGPHGFPHATNLRRYFFDRGQTIHPPISQQYPTLLDFLWNYVLHEAFEPPGGLQATGSWVK